MIRPALLFVGALPLACLDPIAPDVGPMTPVQQCDADLDPTRTVSFSADIAPIFRRACDGCHLEGGEGDLISGLEVETYVTLRAGGARSNASIVIDGEPCASILWQKLGSSPPFGERMPRAQLPLPQAEIDLIHDWIAEGARDN